MGALPNLSGQIRIPAEWEPHACCWMSWALKPYWRPSINEVERRVSEVVQTIARYEPVKVLAPRGAQLREARREFADCKYIEVIEAPVDDIWMRDIAPTFAIRTAGERQEVLALDWNFNGWGGRCKVVRGKGRTADIVASIAGVDCVRARFRAEGGALVFDGRDTAITTRRCLLNPNRNPVVRGNQSPALDRGRPASIWN